MLGGAVDPAEGGQCAVAQTVAGVVVGVVGLVGDPAFAAGAADGLGAVGEVVELEDALVRQSRGRR